MSTTPAAIAVETRAAPAGSRRGRLILGAVVSAVVLVPCFWQRRIQAGDFSSHLYNAWLVQQVKDRGLPGLELATPWTNVLFDVVLEQLIRAAGLEAAQRISVSLLVLNFFWGAFSFVAAVCGRPVWWLVPLLWMLAYGWVFHMGFFNFYLSLGLCFWALALVWRPSRARCAAALALALAATAAHALPAAWAAGLAAYTAVARLLDRRGRMLLFAAAAAGLWALPRLLKAQSVPPPAEPGILMRAALDQLFVYGAKYYLIAVAAAVLCAILLCRHCVQQGLRGLENHLVFSCWVLTLLATLWLPFGLWLPGYKQALLFLPERMSLAATVLLCGVLAGLRAEGVEKAALWALAIPFLGFLYTDHRALNAVEDRIQAAVAAVPPGSRVISALCLAESRIDAIEHMIDRACTGHCYSYGNYEPWTGQFRLRTSRENPVVIADGAVMSAMRRGEHTVRPHEAPLYEVRACGGEICVEVLQAGQSTSRTCMAALGGPGKSRFPR